MKNSRVQNAREDVIQELHKPARRNFNRRRTILRGIDDLWQADLAEFQKFSTQNKNYKFILVIIDCFSKFVWTIALKDKSASSIANAFNNLLKNETKRRPKNLQTDNGKEFYNKQFEKIMKTYNINHYSTYTILKASIVERVIRTLKLFLSKEFTRNGNTKWISILNKITEMYNNRKHRTIQMKPIDVKGKITEKRLLESVYSNVKIAGIAKYKVGDIVRISKQKALFEKGYTRNWSTELFTIKKVKITNPVSYLLEDYNNQPILGAFYEPELQKAKHKDIYLVERVVRQKKGSKVLVKWLGLDSSHNSWVNKKEIII
jgi:hypothetical protein